VAAVKLLNGYIDVEKHYNKLVNPCRSISPGASAVNNITDEMVKDKSKFEQIYAEFIDFIADGVIVGHNLAFDMGFLREKVKKMGKPAPANHTRDTLHLAREMYKHLSLPSFKLTDLRRHFKMEAKNEHRALSDVIATAKLLKKIIEDKEKKDINVI